MKKLLYLAACLATPADRTMNLEWADKLSKKFNVYLPQRDGGLYTDLIKHSGMTPAQAAEQVYLADVTALRACDVLVARVWASVDDGVNWGIGYAAALHKSVVLVSPLRGEVLNPMLWQCAKAVFTEKELWAWVSAH